MILATDYAGDDPAVSPPGAGAEALVVAASAATVNTRRRSKRGHREQQEQRRIVVEPSSLRYSASVPHLKGLDRGQQWRAGDRSPRPSPRRPLSIPRSSSDPELKRQTQSGAHNRLQPTSSSLDLQDLRCVLQFRPPTVVTGAVPNPILMVAPPPALPPPPRPRELSEAEEHVDAHMWI